MYITASFLRFTTERKEIWAMFLSVDIFYYRTQRNLGHVLRRNSLLLNTRKLRPCSQSTLFTTEHKETYAMFLSVDIFVSFVYFPATQYTCILFTSQGSDVDFTGFAKEKRLLLFYCKWKM
jgi:hypothetical protein